MIDKRLTKQSEQKILEALEKAAEMVDNGTEPNAALIKAAEEHQIPAGHIKFMVYAMNTGRTNAHRLSHDSTLEKAAEFPLADTTEVVKALYPDEVKTKQAIFDQSVIADEYKKQPKWLNEKKSMEKAAAVFDWKLTDKKVTVETDPILPMKKAVAQVERYNIDLQQKRFKVAEAREQAIKLARELTDYFKEPLHIPHKEVLQNCAYMFGKTAAAVLANIKESEYMRAKKDMPVNWNDRPYTLVKKAIDLAKQFTLCQEAYAAAEKTAYDESEKLLHPFVVSPKMGRSVLASQSSQTEKSAGLFDAFVGGIKAIPTTMSAMQATQKSKQELHQKDMQDLYDPFHESEIRNLQSEALLNDLMANDDVIRGYDPEEVVDAYNEVAQIAPYASNKKVIIRDLLRKRLSGGGQALDQFVIGDTLKNQGTFKEINAPSVGNLNVLEAIGAIPPHGSQKSVLPK